MGQFNALPVTGEDNRVVASDVAAPKRRKSNITGGAGAGVAVAHPLSDLVQVDAAALRRRRTQSQRRSRRRIDLVTVMHFDNFDIVIIAQHASDLFGQPQQHINADAHIGGLDDHGFVRRAGQGV